MRSDEVVQAIKEQKEHLIIPAIEYRSQRNVNEGKRIRVKTLVIRINGELWSQTVGSIEHDNLLMHDVLMTYQELKHMSENAFSGKEPVRTKIINSQSIDKVEAF